MEKDVQSLASACTHARTSAHMCTHMNAQISQTKIGVLSGLLILEIPYRECALERVSLGFIRQCLCIYSIPMAYPILMIPQRPHMAILCVD